MTIQPNQALSGTLVVMVPCQDGLVVAADSRTTVAGIYLDVRDKIIVPGSPPHTVATVTGTGEIIASTTKRPDDLEAYLANAPRLMDLHSVVRRQLELSATQGGKLT